MRLLQLQVSNIRGIKEIEISPNGKNTVIFGPNGSGKSAVVDAIEFLLTGKISRLAGEGAKDLSVKLHGPHVDYRDRLKDVIVTAKVSVDGAKEPVKLERKMAPPAKLKVDPKSAESLVKPYQEIAESGQHLLSRREILKYITAESGKRAKQVQALLKLDVIEEARAAFVTVKNSAEKRFGEAERGLRRPEVDIQAALSLEAFSVAKCLPKVNELRKLLGGKVLTELSGKGLKGSIKPPGGEPGDEKLSTTQIENYIKQSRELIREKKKDITDNVRQLKKLLDEIAEDAKLKRDLLHKKLLDIGIDLIDEKNVCPLCDRVWEAGLLRDFLQERIDRASVAKGKQGQITKASSAVQQEVDLLKHYLEKLRKALEQFSLPIPKEDLDEYGREIQLWCDVMIKPEEYHEQKKWPSEEVSRLFEKTFLEEKVLKVLEEAIRKSGKEMSKEQKAWDLLTKMETLWPQYEDASEAMRKGALSKQRADAALEHFQKARDSVLEGIYNSVMGDFTSYYTEIHGEDEAGFTSDMKHEGAALRMNVDFHKRGKFPPHAVHSEGHQDSMGLCLYFALNKYMTEGLMKLMILDDVVMSIDATHRKGVCKLLRESFPDRQFIITTHDSAWARQLRSDGIVKQANMVHFLNWSIDTGPIWEFDKDMWDKIDSDLSKDDVPAAAHRLRSNAECFFEGICDSLAGNLEYRGDHGWALGDYGPAALAAYKRCLKKAKTVAGKREDEAKVKELDEIEGRAKVVMDNSQMEQWAINVAVHYNSWQNFTKEDFRPVVDAFKELFDLLPLLHILW